MIANRKIYLFCEGIQKQRRSTFQCEEVPNTANMMFSVTGTQLPRNAGSVKLKLCDMAGLVCNKYCRAAQQTFHK